jgi:hypothetical protein
MVDKTGLLTDVTSDAKTHKWKWKVRREGYPSMYEAKAAVGGTGGSDNVGYVTLDSQSLS